MRRKKSYFTPEPGAPSPLTVSVSRRLSFSEVDPMGVAWHGRYPQFFESSSEALGRRIGLSYKDYFEHNLRAPIVQIHIDYFRSVFLEEEITIQARLLWCEAARMNMEYSILKENGAIAATGFTVQMFTCGDTSEPYIVVPALIDKMRKKWKTGEFKCLQ